MDYIIEQKDNVIHDYYIIDGKKEGIYITYYENGNIWYNCNYINDKLEGEYRSEEHTSELQSH